MPNEYRGEVVIPKVGTLRFAHSQLAELRAKYGPQYVNDISVGLATNDPEMVVDLVAIGTGVDVEAVKAANCPLFPTISSLLTAFNLALYGQREAPPADEGDENPTRISFWSRVKRLFVRG